MSYGVAVADAFGIPQGGGLGQGPVVFLQEYLSQPKVVAFRGSRFNSAGAVRVPRVTSSSVIQNLGSLLLPRVATTHGSLLLKEGWCSKPGPTTNKATFTFPMVASGCRIFRS